MSTIAIYGGSFDPPHLGHVMVVTHLLLNDPSVDSVFVVPCFQQRGKNLTDFDHRTDMCRDAFHWLPRTAVLDIERELGGESLTVRMLEEVHRRYPGYSFRFIMGADLMDTAPSWEGWEEIKRLAPPLIIGRAGIAPLGPGDPTPISPIVSSSIIRRALAAKDYEAAKRYLPAKVLTTIREVGLYL